MTPLAAVYKHVGNPSEDTDRARKLLRFVACEMWREILMSVSFVCRVVSLQAYPEAPIDLIAKLEPIPIKGDSVRCDHVCPVATRYKCQ